MRSFLVGEPVDLESEEGKIPDQLTVVGGRNPQPSNGCVGAAAHIAYIPAYRLFETKKYDGPKEQSTGRVGAAAHKETSTGRVGAAAHCCICLNKIREGAVIVSMPICGHIYHKACLFNWVDLSKNTSCPYCRQDDF
jgi:hypothetical protein